MSYAWKTVWDNPAVWTKSPGEQDPCNRILATGSAPAGVAARPAPVSLDSHVPAKPTVLYLSAEAYTIPFIHHVRHSPKMASLLQALPDDIRRHAVGFVDRKYLPLIVSAKYYDEVTTRTVTRHGDCFRVRSEAPTYDTFFVDDEECLARVLINACCADYEEEGAEVRFSMGSSSAIENCHLWWNRGPEQEEELRGSLKEFLALLGKVYV